MRHLSFSSMILGLALLGAGCGPSVSPNTTNAPHGDVDQNICANFTPDFIHSATGKNLVRVEPSKIAGLFTCDYYTDYKEDFYKEGSIKMAGGPHLSIVLDNLNVADQKKALEYLGAKVETDQRIKMEHFIVRRTKDNSIWEVALVINPNRFVWVDSSNQALTDEETILLAVKMAELIQGKLSIKIEKNPTDLSAPQVDTSPTQEQTVRTFFEDIGSGKIVEAIALMDANAETKAGWKKNFETLSSLKLKAIEPTYQDEWTADRQVYKAFLEITLKSGKESLGWYKGENVRWVTVQKSGDKWLIHELANNP